MASDDDAILLAKIGQLAGKFATRPPVHYSQPLTNLPPGQINRHKNAQNTDQPFQSTPYAQSNNYGGTGVDTPSSDHDTDRKGFQQSSTAWRPSRGGYSTRGYLRGGRVPPAHRNRTLVLSGNSPLPASGNPGANENDNPSGSGSNSGSAWVTKQDRHLQLINTSIFEKDAQKRAKAIEQTRQQKLKQRDERERTRFVRHLQRGNGHNSSSARANETWGNQVLEVNGIRFRVTRGGSKLVKLPGENWPQASSRYTWLGGPVMSLQCPDDINAAKSTPKSAIIGGVRFYRSKSGNMYRSGIIKAHRYEQSYSDAIWLSSHHI